MGFFKRRLSRMRMRATGQFPWGERTASGIRPGLAVAYGLRAIQDAALGLVWFLPHRRSRYLELAERFK